MSPAYKIIVPVWGDSFVARFLQFGLPTQLAPSNLPALPADRCAYHIFTTSTDAEQVRSAAAYRRLCATMPTFIENLDSAYRGHAYAAMTECHNRGLALGRGRDCIFVFLSPDSLWADGSFLAMHRHIEAGKRAVLMAGPRVVAEDVLPILSALLSPVDSSIRLTGRELAALLVRHMHHSTRAYLWENGGSRGAGHYCWTVGTQGLLIRATHLHPVAVRPVNPNMRLTTNLDGDFVGRCCPEMSHIHVVTDSDEMCTLEFSNADYLEGFYPNGPLSRADHLAFLERNTDAHHRDYLRHCIRIHVGQVGPDWSASEAVSESVVAELLREFAAKHSSKKDAPKEQTQVKSSSRLLRLPRAILEKPLRSVHLGPLDPSRMKPEVKYGFVIDLHDWGVFAPSDLGFQISAGTRGVSRLVLLEDGKPLGPAHQMHDVIRNKGMGRFSHWGDGLHFSASDNSDPRTNGRSYTIIVPQGLASLVQRGWWKVKRRLRAA
jgi:hypothetical protein